MLLQDDELPRAAWALKDRRGLIVASDLCETEREALDLRRQQVIHQPHRGELEVVPVIVTVSPVP